MKSVTVNEDFLIGYLRLLGEESANDLKRIRYSRHVDVPSSTSMPEKEESSSSTYFFENDKTRRVEGPLSDTDRQLFYQLMIEKQQQITDRVIDEYVDRLYRALSDSNSDPSDYSAAEELIVSIEHRYSMKLLGDVIMNVYKGHFDEPEVIAGICACLCRYDPDEVDPWGTVMLTGVLNHKSEKVKENAAILVDNWRAVDLLPLLKGLDISSIWLRSNVDQVIHDLEEAKCIMSENSQNRLLSIS